MTIPEHIREEAKSILHKINKNSCKAWNDTPGRCSCMLGNEACLEEVDLLATALLAAEQRGMELAEREAMLNAKSKLRVEFRKALSDLPEIAPPVIASVLSSVHMRDVFLAEGKRLQRVHGTDAVAPRIEQECGAGAWSFMRQGIDAAIRKAREERG